MSLINEALRKARLEAARQDAARRGISLPSGEEPQRRPPLTALAATLLVLAVAGGVLYWLGARSAQSGVEVAGGVPGAESSPATQEVAGSAATATPGSDSTAPPPAEGVPNAPAATPPPTAAAGDPPVPPAQPAAGAPEPAVAAPAPPAEERRKPPAPPAAQTAPASPPPVAEVESAPLAAAVPAPAVAADRPAAEVAADSGEPPPVAESETFVGEASIPGAGTLRLGGIAWTERQPFALINGRVVGAGDRIEGLQVLSVGRAEVVLRADGGTTYLLRLR